MGLLSAPWKLATIGAGVLAAFLGFLLFTSHLENKSLDRQKQELIQRIEHPKTGYIARLTQANANVATLEASVARQNEVIRQRGVEAEAARQELERLRGQLRTAQAETRRMEQRLREFLARGPQGSSAAERVLDVDRRIMEDLNR